MMPFLIHLSPLQDIAPPLLLSIIQYLTRGDFTEFQRCDDYVISCDTLIWAYGAEALMPTCEGKISSENPSLLRGPIWDRPQFSEGFNYRHLDPCLICIISRPISIKDCVCYLFLNSEIYQGDGFLMSFYKLNTMSRFILQTTECSLMFCPSDWLAHLWF